MAIFSRRTLQRMIDENGSLLTCEQLKEHVNRLNGKDADQRVSTEWEVAILNALSKNLQVTFEPPMPTGGKPDVLLAVGDHKALAEITTVSDRGLHEANPMEYLCSEFCRRLRKVQLNPNKFSVKVGGNHTELWVGGNAKATLKLPHPSKFNTDIFGPQFLAFIQSAKELPQQPALMEISTQEIELKFAYNPCQEFFQSSHLSYTVSHQLRNNPLFNRLKRKMEQLREVNYDGTLGIIVCDGGCALLSDAGSRGINYGCRDIVQEFFRSYPRIGFVQIVSVQKDFAIMSRPKRPRAVSTLYAHTNCSSPLLKELSRIHEEMPEPETTPYSAYHAHRCHGRSLAGGWEFNGNMKISVRMLQELLAGRVTSTEFLEAHGNFGAAGTPNIFESRLCSGQLIKGAEIISGESRDDDWIDFEFGEPDPAISPFRMPRD